MDVAVIGYTQSGKSSLYRACAHGQAKGDVAAVPVPDPRFDAIVAQVCPKKQTPATVIFHDDLDPVQPSGKSLTQKTVDQAKRSEVLLHVVRAFESPISAYHATVDPLRDQTAFDTELILTDLQTAENRLEKLSKSLTARQPGSTEYLEKALFERLKNVLESGMPIRTTSLDESEEALLRNYQLLTTRPLVVAFNVDEAAVSSPPPSLQARIELLTTSGTPAFVVCAAVEEEIAQLDSADQPEFLASIGISEPASNRVIRSIYGAMGLITFFTAGENDTRAWALKKGSSALRAAATIHNDIAKGFIRAEVVHYDDYATSGSLEKAYAAGKMTLEGKDYVVRDGDLLHIRNKS